VKNRLDGVLALTSKGTGALIWALGDGSIGTP
jgi:hypothetical protein